MPNRKERDSAFGVLVGMSNQLRDELADLVLDEMLDSEPTAMHVELVLFREDDVVQRGEVLIASEKGEVAFGEHRHVEVSVAPPLTGALFHGLIVEHCFGFPTADVKLRLYEVGDGSKTAFPAQRMLLEAALRMPVHKSEDWETITLREYTIAFKCTPLPIVG